MRDREYSAFMLLNAPGFGSKAIFYIYQRLLNIGLKINDLFEENLPQLTSLLPDIGRGKFSKADLSSLHSLDDDKLYTSYQKLKEENIHVIGLDDERYPRLLFERLGENAPPVLFCKGALRLLNSEGISIVGSRGITDFGTMITKRIANRLAATGYNVTSGFAKGVDTCAHIGALENNGTTIMVLSYGFNHLTIKREIRDYNLEKNALFISQFMPYERFSGQNAMIRNKLVCALSKAVIVISSGPERDSDGKMSGTFDAGLTSLKYNIPLFVLNPSLFTPIPEGNVDLIKRGGLVLSNGNELVQYLGAMDTTKHFEEQITDENKRMDEKEELQAKELEEPQFEYQVKESDDIQEKILSVLNGQQMSVTSILKEGHLQLKRAKLQSILGQMKEVEIIKKGKNTYYRNKTLMPQTKLAF